MTDNWGLQSYNKDNCSGFTVILLAATKVLQWPKRNSPPVAIPLVFSQFNTAEDDDEHSQDRHSAVRFDDAGETTTISEENLRAHVQGLLG